MVATSNNAAASACSHKRTQTVAKDSESQYEECLDCGAILEADELQATTLQATALQPNTPIFRETLSDA